MFKVTVINYKGKHKSKIVKRTLSLKKAFEVQNKWIHKGYSVVPITL